MVEEIQNFETELLLATFKINLTQFSIKSYSSLIEPLSYQASCLKERCLPLQSKGSVEELDSMLKCVTNCETGLRELQKMQ
jgi:hypothetical protein